MAIAARETPNVEHAMQIAIVPILLEEQIFVALLAIVSTVRVGLVSRV